MEHFSLNNILLIKNGALVWPRFYIYHASPTLLLCFMYAFTIGKVRFYYG